MKTWKKCMAATGIAGVVVALDCAAGTLLVPVGVTTNVNVAADTTLTDAVTLADRSAIEKTGAGKLTFQGGQFTQDKVVDLRVREGGVAFTPSPQALAAYPQPTETMNKAAFWLESRTNLVKDGDDIVEWRDVRDVDPTATNHYYAVTDNTVSDLCPQEATYTNKAAVYFQGYGSGCWMNWQNPAGGQATVDNLYHVFFVHGANSMWGYALGQRQNQSPYFQPASPGGGSSAVIWMPHNFENRPMHSSRTFRDGIEVDPFTTGQGKGIHVIEVDCLEMRQSAQCFYNDRDMWQPDGGGSNPLGGNAAAGKRVGGEYICEMLLFTNRLSEAERVSVSNWLLAKWRDAVPPQKPAVVVTLATNAFFKVTGDAFASFSTRGDGTLVKKYADMLVMPSLTQPVSRTLHVRVDEGPLTLGQSLPVVCAAGDTVTSAITYAGPQLTPPAATAGAGRLVKAGNGPLLLDAIPDGVTNLVVSGGLLTLADPERRADLLPGPDRNVTAAIPEWSFECYDATSVNNAYYYISNGSEYQGWHAIVPSGGKGESAVFVFDNTYGAKQYWNLALNAPDGKNCLVVKNDASAWCAFTVPETGEYELEFWAAPRSGYAGTHLDVMIGTGESDLVRVGDFGFVSGQSGWRHYGFDAVSLQAGVTYQLWFKSKNLDEDFCTQFDAIRLKKPEAIVGRWAIPNGDFEKHLSGFVDGFTLDNTNRVVGFAVEQCTSFATTASGETTGAHAYTTFSVAGTDSWAHYNRPWSTGGMTQFYMSGNGSKLVTTFTPPAGTWMLQADFSVWCVTASYGTSYRIAAEVSVGGETISLGEYMANDHRLVARTWPGTFTTDGTTPVTLTLTGSAISGGSHGILDNLALVVPNTSETNLLADPGINVAGGWQIMVTPKPGTISGSALGAWDSFYTSNFGLSKFEGTGYCRLVNDDRLYQSVTFPTGGLYRLTVNLKSRGTTSPSATFGLNPIDVYLAKDGVTNLVGRSDNAATTNFNEYAFMFTVPPAGGAYDVGFRGTSVWGGEGAPSVDHTTLLDAAWLCRVYTARDIGLPGHLNIEVADGAHLHLDFAGTNVVNSLRIAGRSYVGDVSQATHPELYPVLSGPGTLSIMPKGTVFLFR